MIRTILSPAAGVCLLTLGVALGGSALQAQTSKPNIVIFEPDDLDPVTFQTAIDAGLLPNIQTYLLNRGTYFKNYYVSDDRGCPTREAYFNGLYFHNLVKSTSNHQCGVFQFNDKQTIAVWLKQAGYTTSLIGKYMDGYGYEDVNGDGKVTPADATYIPPGWDNFQSMPYYQPQAQGNIPPNGVILPQDNPNEYDWYLNSNGSLTYHKNSPSDYQADVLSHLAANYVTNTLTNTKPFFLLVAPGAPHIETNYIQIPTLPGYEVEWSWDIRPAPRYAGSVNIPLPNPPNFNPISQPGKPQWVQSKAYMTPQDISQDTQQWNDRLASLRAVDDLVGNVLRSLSAKGLAQNTVFMFLSDNGWMYGNYRLGGKLAAYEPAVNVPLIVSSGGSVPVTAGATSAAQIGSNDIAAIITDLTGVTPPYALDGTSFKTVLTNPNIAWRNRFLVEHWQALQGANGELDAPNYKAVRTSLSNTTLTNELFVSYPSTGEFELYKFMTDPWGLTNLAYDPDYATTIHQQQVAEYNLATCKGQACHNAEFQP